MRYPEDEECHYEPMAHRHLGAPPSRTTRATRARPSSGSPRPQRGGQSEGAAARLPGAYPHRLARADCGPDDGGRGGGGGGREAEAGPSSKRDGSHCCSRGCPTGRTCRGRRAHGWESGRLGPRRSSKKGGAAISEWEQKGGDKETETRAEEDDDDGERGMTDAQKAAVVRMVRGGGTTKRRRRCWATQHPCQRKEADSGQRGFAHRDGIPPRHGIEAGGFIGRRAKPIW